MTTTTTTTQAAIWVATHWCCDTDYEVISYHKTRKGAEAAIKAHADKAVAELIAEGIDAELDEVVLVEQLMGYRTKDDYQHWTVAPEDLLD